MEGRKTNHVQACVDKAFDRVSRALSLLVVLHLWTYILYGQIMDQTYNFACVYSDIIDFMDCSMLFQQATKPSIYSSHIM